MWFYQEMDEPEAAPPVDVNKPSTSRAAASSTSKTPPGATPVVQGTNYRLFLTDGSECALTGICIYMFRISNAKQLPEEGFQKDL